jgi:hypothetical protein
MQRELSCLFAASAASSIGRDNAGIIYLIGLIIAVPFSLSFFGLR